jgi:hypothetical protein
MMPRDFHPCEYCCALTDWRDEDGDYACRPGHGCSVKHKARVAKAWNRWTPAEVAEIRRGYANGTPVTTLALSVNHSTKSVMALASSLGIRHASKSKTIGGAA